MNLNFKGADSISEDAPGQIFIMDHHLALNKIDLVENCDTFDNIVVLDSVLRHLWKKNV